MPTCYSAVRHSIRIPRDALTVRLACVRRAASVHPEPGSNSPSKINGPRARPVLTTFTLIGSVRFIWFCLIGKGISRGRLSAALRKTIQVRPFQMVRCLPGCDTSGVSILAVSGSQGARLAADPVRPGRAARRYIARPEGPRGRESGRTHFLHSLGFSAVFTSNIEGTSFPRSPPPSIYRNRLSKP